MNFSEPAVKALLSVGAHNKGIIGLLSGAEVQDESAYALQILNALNSTRVSKVSLFKDMVWDFNEDNPNVSRLVKGVRLRIDFGRYRSIPESVILEIKCVAYLYIYVPGFFKYELDKKPVKLRKPQTNVPSVDQALKFIEQLYLVLREELGNFYIDTTLQSLSLIPSHYYHVAAARYPWAYHSNIELFFRAIQSPGLQGTLFPETVPTVIFDNLPWLRLSAEKNPSAKADEEKKGKLLRNDLFEHSSHVASMVVVDFLEAIGEAIEDKESLGVRNSKRFYLSADNDLSLDKFNVYACYRLYIAGYPLSSFEEFWPGRLGVLNEIFIGDDRTSLRRRCEKLIGSKFDVSFKEYVNYVGYACMYVVAQYTGMRPGELVRLVGASCLKKDSQTGFWLIAGKVEKHQQNLTALFDDYWVAIPIVQDAIRASAILSSLKNNPYVFSRAYTIPNGEIPLALCGAGFDYPMNKFFKGFLSEQEVEEIGFFPYMLRHTLAFQMRRAGLGLPFISHQLKHFGELVGQVEIGRSFSKTTLSYGEIGEVLSKGGTRNSVGAIKRQAEDELIRASYDPDGNYTGPLAGEHKASLEKAFSGYMAAGYTKEEVFQFMAEQNIAVVSIGSTLCYGKKNESFDPSLPCIGGLRCNPSRCKEAVVTEAHAPAWKNIYDENKSKLSDPSFKASYENYKAAMEEARMVLLNLGIEVEE